MATDRDALGPPCFRPDSCPALRSGGVGGPARQTPSRGPAGAQKPTDPCDGLGHLPPAPAGGRIVYYLYMEPPFALSTGPENCRWPLRRAGPRGLNLQPLASLSPRLDGSRNLCEHAKRIPDNDASDAATSRPSQAAIVSTTSRLSYPIMSAVG